MLYTDQKPDPTSQECDHNCTTFTDNNEIVCKDCGEVLETEKCNHNKTVSTPTTLTHNAVICVDCGAALEIDNTDHICSWCHFVTDEKGNRQRWLTAVEYLTLSANSEQSHGICNSCADLMRAELKKVRQ